MNTADIQAYADKELTRLERKRRAYVDLRARTVNTYNSLVPELTTYFAENDVKFKIDGYPYAKNAAEITAIIDKYNELSDDYRVTCRLRYSEVRSTSTIYKHLEINSSTRELDNRVSYQQTGYIPTSLEKFTPAEAVTYDQVVQAAQRLKEVERMQSELKSESYDLKRILNA